MADWTCDTMVAAVDAKARLAMIVVGSQMGGGSREIVVGLKLSKPSR